LYLEVGVAKGSFRNSIEIVFGCGVSHACSGKKFVHICKCVFSVIVGDPSAYVD